MEKFEDFCRRLLLNEDTKTKQATALLWFHCHSTGDDEASISRICELFAQAKLAAPNPTRLRDDFRKSKLVHKGNKDGYYRITRTALHEFDKKYKEAPELTVTERANLNQTPLVSQEEIESAKKMAEIYVIMHCYENSARKLIEKVLVEKLGPTWWDQASNTTMKSKVADRQSKEQKNRWITPRGASPLFYLDWGELLTLMRKYETEFDPFIGDFKFAELRFEELERFRNIVAHHGTLPSEDEFQAIILSFKQWCRQIGVRS